MLNNRYVQAALAVLFLLVAGYNITFFMARRDTRSAQQQQARNPAAPAGVRKAAHAGLPKQQPIPSSPLRRDPFWYQHEAGPAPQTTAPRPAPEQGFRLEGTLIRDGKGYALVSGKIVGVGERVGAYEIVAVGNSEVTVRTGGSTKTIRLLGDTEEKE